MTWNPRIFREYDIRGVADTDLDDQTVTAIGAAIGARAAQVGSTVCVARDCRLHSDRLHTALLRGLGRYVSVVDVGIGPTPYLYFCEQQLKPAAAIMITGSHNPSQDNGFKILIDGKSFFGADLQNLCAEAAAVKSDLIGATTNQTTNQDLRDEYLQAAAASIQLGSRRPKVVVDAGNGAGGPMALALYQLLGFDVVPLFCDMDGRFPNHHPDPTVATNLTDLISAVKLHGAELGIALDGDADRMGAVDSTGRILWGDQLMVLFGRAILQEQPGALFVGEVKCSQSMYDELRKAGGQAEMWKVGHSLIKTRMKQTGAALAGEMSGHLFFAHRWFGFDDGIYAGARLLELLSHGDATLADMAASLPVLSSTPELRIACADIAKFDVVRAVTAAMRKRQDVIQVIDIDGVRAVWPHGWGLVRASNTQAALVMRCEANTDAELQAIVAIMNAEIASATRDSKVTT
jgi:phosphomannomutase / phosphoglucomutase